MIDYILSEQEKCLSKAEDVISVLKGLTLKDAETVLIVVQQKLEKLSHSVVI